MLLIITRLTVHGHNSTIHVAIEIVICIRLCLSMVVPASGFRCNTVSSTGL